VKSEREGLLGETKSLLKKYDVRPQKGMGQSFLIDEKVLSKQASHAHLNTDDIVLEVGAGTGSLTKYLMEDAGRVIVIERDPRLAHLLGDRFSDASNLEILSGDALKVEFPEFNKVVSNIPYSISSPLTFKLLEQGFEIAILTYQKEFAERLIAKPGTRNYSRLSVSTFCQAEAKILEFISRNAFYPVPKVSSAVVKLTPKANPLSLEEGAFQNLLRGLFSHRRKTVSNAAFHSYSLITSTNLEKDVRKENIKKSIPKKLQEKRVYELAPAEFSEILDALAPLRKKEN